MARIPSWRRYLRFWRPDIEGDVDDELRFHLEARTADLVARGVAPDDARRQALAELGDLAAVRAGLCEIDRRMERQRRRAGWWEALAQDLRYAVRGLGRSPGLVVAVVVTLGLGLGANAAIFSIVDRLFFRVPGGVVRAGEIRRIYQTGRDELGKPVTFPYFSFPLSEDVTHAIGSRARIAAYQLDGDVTLGRGDGAPKLAVVWTGPGYFDVLGVRAERGRLLAPDELAIRSNARVAVVSDAFWRSHLGADPAVLGRSIELDKQRYTIVGVAQPEFTGIDVDAVDAWVPLAAFTGFAGSVDWRTTRETYWIQLIARLAAGTDDREIASAATAGARSSERAARRADSLLTITTGPIIAARGPGLREKAIPITTRLAGVALVVLLIACANVANLLLARAMRRRREIAVRLALGISRRRLMAQLVAESALLAIVAALGALLIGTWGGVALRAALMPDTHWGGAVLSPLTVAVVVLAALGCGLAAGIAPALQATRPDLTSALKQGAREGTVHRSRLRSALIVVQAALSVVLLVGAGVFVRSLVRVEGVDLGYDADRLVFARATWDGHAEERGAVLAEVGERLRRMPGVEHVALASIPPMRGFSMTNLFIPGRDSLPTTAYGFPTFSEVSPEFFATTGTRILRGRAFTPDDRAGAPQAVIVNETMARAAWPGEDPIGQCVHFGTRTSPCAMVVGVAEDAHRGEVVEHPTMQYFVPLDQPLFKGHDQRGVLIVRTPPERSAAVAAAARQLLHERMPGAELHVQRMADLLAPEYRPWRLGAALFSALGLLALLVAAVGVYSAVAYVFSQRTHEIGVRMALGARAADVLRLVVGEGVRLVGVGVVVGCLLALAAGRLIASMLYGTSPHDPVVMAGVALVLLLVAAAASLTPAWRAARVDPAEALRAE